MIHIREENICRAWEKALIEVIAHGQRYSGDYYGIDSPLIVEVLAPMMEPRIHKCIPCGLDDLWIYRQEVLEGIHDSWIRSSDTAWEYTYSHRIYENNQVDIVLDKLMKDIHTRQAVIKVSRLCDNLLSDPSCLQYIAFRIDTKNRLNMTTHWRSRDLFKAWNMNSFAMIEFMYHKIFRELQKHYINVWMGQYTDISDSAHIYKNDIEKVEMEVKKYSAMYGNIKDRSYDSNSDLVKSEFKIGEDKIRYEVIKNNIG